MSDTADLNIHEGPKLVADTAPVLASTSVGYLLSQAREELGIEIEKVAERLNLGSDVIRAIENNHTAGLPPRPFLQGHIRSYAKMVNLDLALILPLWEKENPPPLPDKIISTESNKRIHRMQRSNLRASKQGKRKRAIWLTVFFLLIVVIGLSLLSFMDSKNHSLARVLGGVSMQRQAATSPNELAITLPQQQQTAASDTADVALPVQQEAAASSVVDPSSPSPVQQKTDQTSE